MTALQGTAINAMTAPSRTRLTPLRVVLAFVAAQVPLTLLAAALEWCDAGEPGSVADILRHGSPISGPLQPQLILLTLALGIARGPRRVRTLATAGAGVMGVLIVLNGFMGAANDPAHAPRAAAIVGGLAFVAAGATITTVAIRALRARRTVPAGAAGRR